VCVCVCVREDGDGEFASTFQSFFALLNQTYFFKSKCSALDVRVISGDWFLDVSSSPHLTADHVQAELSGWMHAPPRVGRVPVAFM